MGIHRLWLAGSSPETQIIPLSLKAAAEKDRLFMTDDSTLEAHKVPPRATRGR